MTFDAHKEYLSALQLLRNSELLTSSNPLPFALCPFIMPTDFKNELYFPDGTAGELKTVTTTKVWDCVKKQWANSAPVILRNALLHAQHPFLAFCIGEIPTDTKDANLLNDFKPPGEFPLMKLDMASNSRNHGRFTFCEKPVAKYYYKAIWEYIIYGSILHTGCKKLTYIRTSPERTY